MGPWPTAGRRCTPSNLPERGRPTAAPERARARTASRTVTRPTVYVISSGDMDVTTNARPLSSSPPSSARRAVNDRSAPLLSYAEGIAKHLDNQRRIDYQTAFAVASVFFAALVTLLVQIGH
jgi:hypothetical protein